MALTTIDRLNINSPYTEPTRHWRYERETQTLSLIEGRIWLTEAPPADRVGIDIPSDGGAFLRRCTRVRKRTCRCLI